MEGLFFNKNKMSTIITELRINSLENVYISGKVRQSTKLARELRANERGVHSRADARNAIRFVDHTTVP